MLCKEPLEIRKCARLQGRQGKIADIAMARTSQKDMKGTVIKTSNAFSVLEDDDIADRALEMGVNVDDCSLEKVSVMKDLENVRKALRNKHANKKIDEEKEAMLAPYVIY